MNITGNNATDAGDYTVRITSQTGKWADGSTDAVTAVWSIGKAHQEAPVGLSGAAPTEEGGDGKITGVDAAMGIPYGRREQLCGVRRHGD